MPKKRLVLIATLILFLILGLIVHKDALKTPLFWDDEATVLNNVFIKDIRFIKQIFTSGYHGGAGEITNLYRPVTNLSFLIEYHLWKINSIGYHLTNLCLHIINAFLVFLMLRWLSKNKAACLLGAVLFLIHPVVTEVVNYVSHRSELLMTLFLLAGFLSYMRFTKDLNKRLLLVSAVFFTLSIFSKEMGLILPLFLLLYHRLKGIKNYRFLTPFVIIALVYIALRATVLNFLDVNIITQGAQTNPYSSNILERLLIFSKIFFTYVKILFLPLNLHMDRDVPFLTSAFELGALIKALFLLAVIGAIIKNRRRPVSFWQGWFMVGLLPVSGIIPINTAISEHYLYMPSIGFFACIGYYLFQLYLKCRLKVLKISMLTAGVILFLALALLSTARNKEWNDPLTLYLSTVNNTQQSFRGTNNAGVEYFKKGSLQTAEYYFKESLKILSTYSPALNNMGVIAQRKGEIDKAIDLYKKAIEYEKDYLLAYRNLYSLYLKLGRASDAEEVLEKLLAIFPYDNKAKTVLEGIKSQGLRKN